MAYLIDSDWVIDHLTQVPEAIQFLNRLSDEPLYISIVTFMEVYQGAFRAEDTEQALSDLRAFVRDVPILPFDEPVAIRCAELRESLLQQGKRPNRRAFDLLIAATALETI